MVVNQSAVICRYVGHGLTVSCYVRRQLDTGFPGRQNDATCSRIRMMVFGLGTAILLVGSTFASTAEATTIYSFDGFVYTASTTTANTTASDFSFTSAVGSSVCWTFAAPNVACGGFGSAIGEFTVAPLASYSLTVTGLSFDERNSGSVGPTAFDVLTSADGFTSPIVSGALAQMPRFHQSCSVAVVVQHHRAVRCPARGNRTRRVSDVHLVGQRDAERRGTPGRDRGPGAPTMLLLGTGLGFVAARRRRSIE
jgi:hypothetical protein